MSRKKREYRSSALQLGNGIHTHGQPGRRYRMGAVSTVHGFVKVYAEGFDEGEEPYARLSFIHKRRDHELTQRTAITEAGLIRVARRFAAAVVAGRPDAAR